MRTCVLGALIAASGLPASAQPEQPANNKDMHLLERHATTPEQFRMLSRHFRQEAESFRTGALEQKLLLENEQKHPSGPSKSPSASDRARQLQHYFERRADEAALKARTYEVRADAAPTPKHNQ